MRASATLLVVVTTPEPAAVMTVTRSEEHTSELQSRREIVCRLLLEKKKTFLQFLFFLLHFLSLNIPELSTLQQVIASFIVFILCKLTRAIGPTNIARYDVMKVLFAY